MKTIKEITLQNQVFYLEEDAHQHLTRELEKIKKQPANDEEYHIVEKDIFFTFKGLIGESKEVITLADVKSVLNDIQGVETIEDADVIENYVEDDKKSSRKKSATGDAPGYKRLYRDPRNFVLGGICGGLGAYFRIDPIWFRLLFIILLLAFGTGPLIYILLWFIIPKARTKEQIAEMHHGKTPPFRNHARREYNEMKTNIKNPGNPDRPSEVAGEVVYNTGSFLGGLARVFLALIGFGLVVGGIITFLSIFGIFIFEDTIIDNIFTEASFSLRDIFNAMWSGADAMVILICLAIAIGIPVLTVFIVGLKMIFGIRANNRVVAVFAIVVWILSVTMLSFMFGFEGQHFANEGVIKNTITLPKGKTGDTLYLYINHADLDELKKRTHYAEIENFGFYFNKDGSRFHGKPILKINRSNNDETSITITRYARGRSLRMAEKNADNIQYHWNANDSAIFFDPYYSTRPEEPFRASYVKIELNIPGDKTVFISEKLPVIMKQYQDDLQISSYQMAGKMWKIGSNDNQVAKMR